MTYTQAASLLREQDQILILTHRRPDGDTVGSAGALCAALRDMGKCAYVLDCGEFTAEYLPHITPYLMPAGFGPAFVISVDVAAVDMLPPAAAPWQERVDLSIDHHGGSRHFARHTCTDPQAAACAELLWFILRELTPITREIAMLLYLGLSTDTGCFRFSNTTAQTHQVTAAVMETGIDVAPVNKRLFDTKSMRRLQLEAFLTSRVEFLDNGRTAAVLIPWAEFFALGADEDDADNISGFVRAIQGVDVGITIRELPSGESKISLRTDAQVLDAAKVCALLGGGGHAAAAGATLPCSLEQAREQVLLAIRQVPRHG